MKYLLIVIVFSCLVSICLNKPLSSDQYESKFVKKLKSVSKQQITSDKVKVVGDDVILKGAAVTKEQSYRTRPNAPRYRQYDNYEDSNPYESNRDDFGYAGASRYSENTKSSGSLSARDSSPIAVISSG